MLESLQHKLALLQHKPGVYQYYNVAGELLYVGKAKNLFKRVHSYWQNKNHSPWTRLMVAEITDLRTIEVSTELEALLLENSLIKSLRPKYNIQLKDDKTFPFLKVSNDTFPTFSVVRQVRNDKARYFGPYFSSTYLRTMLKLLQGLYGIKTMADQSYEAKSSLPNQIGLGARNLDNKIVYNDNVEAAIRFISAPQPQMEKSIKIAMNEAAELQQFERAAILRDRLLALKQLRLGQSLFGAELKQRDYVGIEQVGKLISVYVLLEREGKIVDHNEFRFEFPAKMEREELLQWVVSYLYINGLTMPKEIVVDSLPLDARELAESLTKQAGRRITFVTPKRGELKARLEAAQENARYQLKLEVLKKNRRENSLADLAKILSLPRIPRRIEAFDISNLGPNHIVGASIVFIDGQPAKGEYRKYKINTPVGQDDFASMRELVFRRLSNKERPLPNLLLIDGGKGQLSAAIDAMTRASVSVPLISLAKKEELIYTLESNEPITLAQDSDALLLLTAIRDEVHRFVITFHRQRRSKAFIPSEG